MAKPQTFLFISCITPQLLAQVHLESGARPNLRPSLRAQVQLESGAQPNTKPSFSFFISHRSCVLKFSLKVVRGQTSNLPPIVSTGVNSPLYLPVQTCSFVYIPQLRAQVHLESGAWPNLKPALGHLPGLRIGAVLRALWGWPRGWGAGEHSCRLRNALLVLLPGAYACMCVCVCAYVVCVCARVHVVCVCLCVFVCVFVCLFVYLNLTF